MRPIRRPLVGRDLIALVDHIAEATQGDFVTAERRLGEVDVMLADIAANPISDARLRDSLQGWLVLHGGRGQQFTIVFRADMGRDAIYVALVAFGGQDWMTTGMGRRDWGR